MKHRKGRISQRGAARAAALAVAALALAILGAAALFWWRSRAVDLTDFEGLRDDLRAAVPGTVAVVPPDAADRDGWESEVFGDAALAQLVALGKLLEGAAQGAAIDAAALSTLTAADYSGPQLRPAALEEVFRDAAFVVRRAAQSETYAPVVSGAAGLARDLTALLEPFAGATDLRTKLKLFRVELASADPASRWGLAKSSAYFHLSGRTPRGTFQVQSTWHTEWSTARSAGPGAPPRLARLHVEDYEEVEGFGAAGAMFADCTEAVLAKNKVFDTQLRPGIDHWLNRIDIRFGLDIGGWQGLALADVDGDGLEDVYVCQPGGLPNLLLVQNTDGTATETSAAAGVDFLDSSHGAIFADLDNDGDQDLLAGVEHGVVILENDGRGRFEHRAAEVVPAAIPYSLAAADYDDDGDLDFYVACYNRRDATAATGTGSQRHIVFARPVPYHDAHNGGPNILFRNDGAWRFAQVTKAVGLDANNRRFSYAAAWEDYDGDGDLDLYVANDFGRNNLYRNDGARFADVAAEAGVEDISPGMSVCWGDYDNDGLPDLYVSNMFSSAGNRITTQARFHAGSRPETLEQFRRHARGNSLFRNLGGNRFEDTSVAAGVVIGRWAWGSKFVDLNSDGWEDLVVANGFITQEDPAADDL